jgi:hypothetical protein
MMIFSHRFAYFEDTQELQIMPPLPVHEQPAAHLSKAINKYTDALPYDKLLINVTTHLNHRIQNKDTTNIPDLHLAVTIQPPEDDSADDIEIPKPASKWVGESGLSSDYNFMVRKLSGTCDSHHNINLALIIAFKERTRWHQPKETSVTAQTLRAIPALEYEEFIPARINKSLKFGPVIIHSHSWIDISEVRYSVFRRGTDGHFDFNSRNPDTFAEGVRSVHYHPLLITAYTLQTLYPTVQMSDVERVLRDGANALKGYIVSLMEGMNLEASAIQLVHESNPTFEPVWGAALNQISSAIYLTAYCRYLDWRHHKYNKRKITHDEAAEISSATTTSVSSDMTLVSSDPSTSLSDLGTSSSDPTISSSTGLLADAHPEPPLAKKAKTQSAEDSEPKSKSKSKQTKGKGKS